MSIKITLPEFKVDEKAKDLQIRSIFGNDVEKKEGILTKVLVFIQIYQPLTITELKDKIQGYYQKEVDRVVIFRAVDRLTKLGLLNMTTSGDILAMLEDEKSDIHRHIEAKHRKFLSAISPQFRNRYNNVNYTWVANGDGLRYLEWCCKLLGFKYSEDK